MAGVTLQVLKAVVGLQVLDKRFLVTGVKFQVLDRSSKITGVELQKLDYRY